MDIQDLNNVRNFFGNTGATNGTLPGDTFPFDGLVNIDDLNGVRNNFVAGTAAVPEPDSVGLFMCGMLSMFLNRRKQSRGRDNTAQR